MDQFSLHFRLGQALKKERKARKLTQADLATQAEISVPTVRLLEQGMGHLQSLWAITTVLNIKLIGRNLPDGMRIGERLAQLRRRRRVSQNTMAQWLGVSRNTLGSLECHSRGRFDVMAGYLHVLGCDVCWLPVHESPQFYSHAGNSSGQQDWQTPPELLESLYTVFHRFDLDPCSPTADRRRAPVKAKVYFTADDDGLTVPWFGTVFMNPPYGRELRHWVKKGRDEVDHGNAHTVVALIPARTDTTWWHDYIASQADVIFLRGRLSFGQAGQSAPFPSALVIWSQRDELLSRLASVFPGVGVGERGLKLNGRISGTYQRFFSSVPG